MTYIYVSTNGKLKKEVFIQSHLSLKEVMELKGFDPNGQIYTGKNGRIRLPFIYLVYTQVTTRDKYALMDELLKKGVDLERAQDEQGITIREYLFDVALIKKDEQFFQLLVSHESEIEKTRQALLRRREHFMSVIPPLPTDFLDAVLTLTKQARPSQNISTGGLIAFLSDLFKTHSPSYKHQKSADPSEHTALLNKKFR